MPRVKSVHNYRRLQIKHKTTKKPKPQNWAIIRTQDNCVHTYVAHLYVLSSAHSSGIQDSLCLFVRTYIGIT